MTTPMISPITGLSALSALPGRPCPIAAGLEVVGERWALLVVRELALGAHRFTDIVAGTGAPRDRIAARLRALTEAGVVERRQYQSGPDRFEYHLTESGLALLPVLDALLVWAATGQCPPTTPISSATAPCRPPQGDTVTELSATDTDRDDPRETQRQPPTTTTWRTSTGVRSTPAPSPGTTRSAPPRRASGWPASTTSQAMIAGKIPPPPISRAGPDGPRRGRAGSRGVQLHPGRVGVQPDRRRPRRAGLHAARLGGRLRAAQHAAPGQGLHLGRDQGELPQGGARDAAAG